MLTSHGRKLDHLRVSVTDRCQMRCTYCMAEEHNDFADRKDLLTAGEIESAVAYFQREHGLSAVRLTGGEPLVRDDVIDIAARIGWLKLDDLSLTTNGALLAPMAKALKHAGVLRVNISIDSLQADRFARITRGASLAAVLDGIHAALAAGLKPVKLNAVLLADENLDELADLVRFAADAGAEIRFLELMAIGEAGDHRDRTFLSAAAARQRIEREIPLTPLPRPHGATAYEFAASINGRPVRVGFIAPVTEPFCSQCRRLRLTARGELIGCIMRDRGPSLRDALRAGQPLDSVVHAAVAQKPIQMLALNPRRMHTIGG